MKHTQVLKIKPKSTYISMTRWLCPLIFLLDITFWCLNCDMNTKGYTARGNDKNPQTASIRSPYIPASCPIQQLLIIIIEPVIIVVVSIVSIGSINSLANFIPSVAQLPTVLWWDNISFFRWLSASHPLQSP